MTITLQAVNELIQSLESAGELSIKETKVMALAKAYQQLAAENAYLLNGAARELNTSWMFHKTMLGAQAALACLALGREYAAREWLEGTTDEAGAEIPDDITVAGLQAWFDSQMVSNDGKSGFLTRAEAEEAIRKACPATDAYLAGIKADTAAPLVSALKVIANSEQHNGDTVVCDFDTLISVAACALRDYYAQQLREGADK
ncbi:Uncharacterised protein [Klebsiella oxytoca]|uniref:hypothetical protein n=1 Tax=Klebsiella oxytoca TaxID=571 RepID=UPI0007CBB567|nr:hypothetical protein [Klebsiella oxytoca]SAQ01102.1 Uncharacterised protein [Klebsiella oxytoca]